jgi:hypothetical protein
VKPFAKVKKVCKKPQKRSKIASLFTKKKANIKKMLTNNSEAKDSKKSSF